LIKWLPLLETGVWPPEHKESGYLGGSPRFSSQAKFIKAAEVYAELSWRLTQCKIDGLLLEYAVQVGYEDMIAIEDKLARALETTPRDVHIRIMNCLSYCIGRRRKNVTYSRYCIQRKSYYNHKGGLKW
jgi:hypothetical protein